MLALPAGHRPQTIYVSRFALNTGRTPAFALSPKGPFYMAGLSWKSDARPLFVTFALSPDIARITTGYQALEDSDAFDGKQQMLIPPDKMIYDFDVEFTSGDSHDPQIEVEPISR